MSFRSKAVVRTLFVLALGSRVRAQTPPQAPSEAPVQTSTQATAPLADADFYALRGPAAAGDAQAQFALGNYYFRGRSLTLEHAEALTWYRKSADQGYAPAENQLGTMYQHGFGVVRNFTVSCSMSDPLGGVAFFTTLPTAIATSSNTTGSMGCRYLRLECVT